MNSRNVLFLFIMIGMLLQGVPNIFCASAEPAEETGLPTFAARMVAKSKQKTPSQLRLDTKIDGVIHGFEGDLANFKETLEQIKSASEVARDAADQHHLHPNWEKFSKDLLASHEQINTTIKKYLKSLKHDVREAFDEVKRKELALRVAKGEKDLKIPFTTPEIEGVFNKLKDLQKDVISQEFSLDTAFKRLINKHRKSEEDKGKSALELHLESSGASILRGAFHDPAVREYLNEIIMENLFIFKEIFMEGVEEALETAAPELRKVADELIAGLERARQELNESLDDVQARLKKVTNAAVDGVREISTAGFWGAAKIGAALLGVFAVGCGVYLGAREVKKYLDKPEIIKETNIPTIKQRLAQLLSGTPDQGMLYPLLANVVLNDSIAHSIERIKLALQGTKNYGGYFTNCLLWGPPGTGKTMTAKALANEVDCYWMLLSGSSLMQLTRAQAIQEIDAIFEFAVRQSKPVVIIIDEADPMFERRTERMDRDTLAVMSHFMQKTGTKRSDIMFIAMTNRPADFDPAVLQRFPDQIKIGLPGRAERYAIVRFNIVRLLQKQRIDISAFTSDVINWVAEQTEGMSGREIEDFITLLHQEYNIARQRSKDAQINEEMIKQVLADSIHKMHVAKHGFKEIDEASGFVPTHAVAS